MSTVGVEAQRRGPVPKYEKEAFLECSFQVDSHLWELEASSTLGEEVPWKGAVLNSRTQAFHACSLPLASHPREVQASSTGVEARGNAM